MPAHGLRRYSATYSSRNGVPLEVVSKVILRHQDLKTTQVYLGKINDPKAIRWMDVRHGKRIIQHNHLKHRGLWGSSETLKSSNGIHISRISPYPLTSKNSPLILRPLKAMCYPISKVCSRGACPRLQLGSGEQKSVKGLAPSK